MVIDLTPVKERRGPARLLDMVPMQSKTVFKTWLHAQNEDFRNGIEVVAMGPFAVKRGGVVGQGARALVG